MDPVASKSYKFATRHAFSKRNGRPKTVGYMCETGLFGKTTYFGGNVAVCNYYCRRQLVITTGCHVQGLGKPAMHKSICCKQQLSINGSYDAHGRREAWG